MAYSSVINGFVWGFALSFVLFRTGILPPLIGLTGHIAWVVMEGARLLLAGLLLVWTFVVSQGMLLICLLRFAVCRLETGKSFVFYQGGNHLMQCSFLGMAAVVAVGRPSISRFIHTDRCARTRYSELALDRTVTNREFFPMRTRTLSDIAVASTQ